MQTQAMGFRLFHAKSKKKMVRKCRARWTKDEGRRKVNKFKGKAQQNHKMAACRQSSGRGGMCSISLDNKAVTS